MALPYGAERIVHVYSLRNDGAVARPRTAPFELLVAPERSSPREEARQAYVANRRQLADAWINTGRRGDVEVPRERKLNQNLWRTLHDWAAENRPDISFADSGETVLVMPATKIDYKSPIAAAKKAAVLLFGVFLDSPFRSRLFKC
jgi:hypothetical protein